jgi:hypothetical protein
VTLAYSAVTANVEPEDNACALIGIADTNNGSTLSTSSENNNMNNPNERFSPITCYMHCVSNKQFKLFIVKIFLLFDQYMVNSRLLVM